MRSTPALTCILTASAGEGAAVAHSLRALLALEGDLEVVLIDHGADAGTRVFLTGLADPRLRVLRMAPAPRGAARNRGLAHARGARLCVLAPGDSLAPFALPAITRSTVDCLFLPASSRMTSGQLHTVGKPVFDMLAGTGLEAASSTDPLFSTFLTRLALLPAQPGLRVLRHEMVREHALSFAHDASSGWLFSVGALMNADSLGVATLPAATLWETSDTGFATLSDVAQALHLFERARHFHDPALRLALLGAMFCDLEGIAKSLSVDDQQDLKLGCTLALTRLDNRLRQTLSKSVRDRVEEPLAACAPWLSAALDFAQARMEPPDPVRSARQSAIARLVAWRPGSSGGAS